MRLNTKFIKIIIGCCKQGHLNSIKGPRAKQHTGANTCKTTHRKKSANVDKIKHIFIVLVFPTKLVFKHDKNAVHTIHKLA